MLLGEITKPQKPLKGADNADHILESLDSKRNSRLAMPKYKAIWAIANSSWPAKCLTTAGAIQSNASDELIELLINSANDGDFSLWDNARERLLVIGQ